MSGGSGGGGAADVHDSGGGVGGDAARGVGERLPGLDFVISVAVPKVSPVSVASTPAGAFHTPRDPSMREFAEASGLKY